MSKTIQFAPHADRLEGPHNFNKPPKAAVAAHVLRSAQNVRMTALSIHDPDKRMPSARRTELGSVLRHQPEVSVLRLRDARVSGTGLVLTDTGGLLAESNLRPPHVISVSDGDATLETAPTAPICFLRDAPVVALNGAWPVHYGHWTYDNFARLGLAQDALGFRPYSVLTGYKHRGRQWCKPETTQARMLGYAGIGMGQIHRLADHEWAEVADLLVVSPLNNFRPPINTIFAQQEIFTFLSRIGNQARASGCGPRIYCSRRDTQNRRMDNEEDLISAMADQFGFVEIRFSEHNVDKQIAIFREAEIVIGPIGNAFMNMAYMNQNAKLLTFLPVDVCHFLPYYQSFATASGLDIHAMIAETTNKATEDLNSLRWRVNIDDAISCVRKILS